MSTQQNAPNALSATAKPCEECGNPFTPARQWARFCKTSCRNEFHRKKALGPDGRIKELEQAIAELRRDAHPPFDFDHLVKRLERLEAIARGEVLAT